MDCFEPKLHKEQHRSYDRNDNTNKGGDDTSMMAALLQQITKSMESNNEMMMNMKTIMEKSR